MMGAKYTHGADYKMFQMSFFIGYPLAVVTHITINKIFPPNGLGLAEVFHNSR
jgi:NCS1 family nucleobase:cation symporter-1